MIFSKEQIVNDISNFIVRFAGRPQNCYIGISKDALERLFRGHQVQIMNMNDFRFYRAASAEEARTIERFFLDRGLQGGERRRG